MEFFTYHPNPKCSWPSEIARIQPLKDLSPYHGTNVQSLMDPSYRENVHKVASIGESLLASLFTFLLISIRLYK